MVRRNGRLWIFFLALLLVMTACGQAVPSEGTADAGQPPAPSSGALRLATTWPYPFHGNPFGPGGVGGAWWFMYEPFAHYLPQTQEYLPRLAESWSIDGQKVTVKLKKGLKFSDGQPFTARDVVSTVTMIQAVWSWPYEIQNVTAPDDETVVFTLWENTNPQGFLYTLLTNGAMASLAPYHLYEPFLEEASQVASLGKAIYYRQVAGETVAQEEKDQYDTLYSQLRDKIDAFAPFKDQGSVPVVGPFGPQKVTQNEMILTANPHHWERSQTAVDEIRFKNWSSNEFVWGALLSGELDAAHPSMPKDVVDQLGQLNPELHGVTVSDLSDVALLFNFRKLLFQDPALRQAIAYALDRNAVRDIAAWQAASYDGSHDTGLLKSAESAWIPADAVAQLPTYTYDPEKAARILEAAGYTKGSKGWMTPHGQPVAFTVSVYGPHNDWVLAAREVVNQLKDFGFQVDLKLIPEGMRDQVILGGDFDAAVDFGSAWWGFPHPVTGYDRLYSGDVAKATGFPVKEASPLLGGATPEEVLLTLRADPQGPRAKEAIAELARFTSQMLPVIPLYEKVLPIYYSEQRWAGWPAADDPLWSLAPGGIERVYLILATSGQLKPR